MSIKRKIARTKGSSYLTKRILISAAKSGVRKAAKDTMEVMGYIVIAEDRWIIRKYSDGRIERIEPIIAPETTEFILD